MRRNHKKTQKILASAIVMALLAGSGLATTGNAVLDGLTVNAATAATEIVSNGNCGNNVTYTLDSNGTLTIEGTGGMYDYKSDYTSPFYNNSKIKKVIIKNGVTTISDYIFMHCSNLTSITIPNSVTRIGNGAFYGCSSLTNITIPNSVTRIGNGAFESCYNLTNITIPNSVIRIGARAFSYCSNLTNITIPNSVTKIGDNAFYNCKSLTNITIPNSVIKIGVGAFGNCSSLTEFNVNSKNKNFSSVNGVLFSKDKKTLLVYPNGKPGTPYTIPNSVTNIGERAFQYCYRLTSITIPNSVTNIGVGAFQYCYSLANITIPNSVTNIGERAFYGCSSSILTNITIPNSVTSIGDNAFSGCSSLTEFNVNSKNKNFSSVNGVLFSKDKKTLLVYPNGKSGTSYTIPNSVTRIGDYAFWNCSNLTNITIPDSVTSIGYGAFQYCSSLTNITIPDSVTSIGEEAFSYCSSLTNINISNNSKLTSIGDDAFHYCSNLTNITIPNSVTNIGVGAFSYCLSLTNITIPNSVTSIGDNAFWVCKNLTIYGEKDSYAEQYAERKYYITFKVKLTSTSSISAKNIALGEKVTLNGSSIGGEGNIQYSYFYKKASSNTWTTIKKYSPSTFVKVQPKHRTVYDICIKAKDSKGTVSKKYFKVTVGEKLKNTSTVSTTNIKLGEKITLNGKSLGGKDKVQYTYCYKPTNSKKWTVLKGYSDTATFNFKPKEAGTYDICIKAKDSADVVDKKYFKVAVAGNTSTINKTKIKLGEKVTLNGSSIGGEGNIQYSYFYKKASSNTWTTIKKYSSSTFIKVEPKHRTVYDICIKAKDSKGTVCKKYFKVTVE